jgi:epoxyqueuosine reductase
MMQTRKDKIKDFAIELGFDKIGFSPAEPCLTESNRLMKWFGKNYHGELSWLAESMAVRLDPSKLLPGVKTILSAAVNYYNIAEYPQGGDRGKISRYAWGNDYHSVVANRLDKLFVYIKTLMPAIRGKVCVDSAHLLEKFWAERSGIGWRGKHTVIITEELGSWIFLGEILLTEEFEYDTPQADRCGSCSLCIDACPTRAIVEPYVLDVRKCLSYMTVEYKGEFPNVMRQERSGWLYGCDICQEVCPWNRDRAQQTRVDEFFMREDIVAPPLNTVISMTEKEFAERFKNSPVKRIKLRKLQRNAHALLEMNQKT